MPSRGIFERVNQPIDCRKLVFDLGAQCHSLNWERRGSRCGECADADAIFFGREERCGSGAAGGGLDASEIGGGVVVMVCEDESRGELHAGRFEALKKLIRARNAAESGDGAPRSNVDIRDFHSPVHAPNLSVPAARSYFSFHIGFVRRNRDDLRARCCMQRLAQIAGGK